MFLCNIQFADDRFGKDMTNIRCLFVMYVSVCMNDSIFTQNK